MSDARDRWAAVALERNKPITAEERATLASLRPGPNGEPARCVCVPREPTQDFWPSYCASNGAQPGSAWDTLSQKLYRAIVAHVEKAQRHE